MGVVPALSDLPMGGALWTQRAQPVEQGVWARAHRWCEEDLEEGPEAERADAVGMWSTWAMFSLSSRYHPITSVW